MNKQRGFIGLIIVLIVALVLAKYIFNFSIFDAASSPQGQGTISYTNTLLHTIWSYISTPVLLFWDRILLPLLEIIWKNFQAFLVWAQHPGNTI